MSATSTSNRVLVIGRGKSGQAAAELARSGGSEIAFTEDCAFAVVSPGVRVMSELEYGCRQLRKRGVKLLAVTGSKGKSSVVKVVTEALELAGHSAVACGNYGLPVSEVALRESMPEWAVVEVSSFMMETTNLPPDAFEAAAILNLQVDHLDRHGSIEVYHSLKRRLHTMAKCSVSADSIGDSAALIAGSYFDNAILSVNGAIACGLMRIAGLNDDEIRRAFVSFKSLPHRFELVAELDGVRYVDDSKATSIEALVAGITMAGEKIRLIAGGLPKGDDPLIAVSPLTNRVKKVYLIGDSAEKFAAAWRGCVDCEICGTLERAVAAVKREAVKGETVLLSPGAASFDQFTSYGQRGERFAELVKNKEDTNE